jgi:hypothetical protein
MYLGVARSIELSAALGRIPRGASERRLALIEQSLDMAKKLVADGKLDEAFEVASGVMPLEHISSSQIPGKKLAAEARRLIREMSQQVRTEIREAYKDKRLSDVVQIGEAAGDLLVGLPDGAMVYARALHGAGRTGEALGLMKRAHAHDKESFVATWWAGRLGALAGDYSTALEMYAQLRRSSDPEKQRIEREIGQFFAGAGPRAMKQLRRLVVAGNYEEALRLARLIKQEVGSEERVERELARLHGILRKRLREIEEGEGDAEEGEAVLRQMIEVRPDDTRALRKLALQLMSKFRFAEAAQIWDRIRQAEPDNDTAPRQRERCLKMAQRRAQAWGTEIEAAA